MSYVVGCLGEPGEGMKNVSVRLRCRERGAEEEGCVTVCRHLALSPFASISPPQVNFYKTPFLATLAVLPNSTRFRSRNSPPQKNPQKSNCHLNLSFSFLPVNLHFYTRQGFLLPVQCKHKVAITKTSDRTVESFMGCERAH